MVLSHLGSAGGSAPHTWTSAENSQEPVFLPIRKTYVQFSCALISSELEKSSFENEWDYEMYW